MPQETFMVWLDCGAFSGALRSSLRTITCSPKINLVAILADTDSPVSMNSNRKETADVVRRT